MAMTPEACNARRAGGAWKVPRVYRSRLFHLFAHQHDLVRRLKKLY
jgi:hypothetical protein